MFPQIKQIADRIKELRDILDISSEKIASDIGVSTEQYLEYESAVSDIPVGKLYLIADVLGVDPTVLLVGEDPRMADYTIIRGGNGIRVERYAGYEFSSLAYNYKNREMEPMIVTLKPTDTPDLVKHEGQEFNYVISGKVAVTVGEREFILNAGDSIYFNPKIPHGQRAVDETAKFLTVINERMSGSKSDK